MNDQDIPHANGPEFFASRFRSLTGRTPYRWQQRLHSLLMAGEIPDALDLPTGLGKTSVLAIWLLAKAAGAPLPRRLVYVVDRRAVVDQASAEAESLRQRLACNEPDMIALRDALRLDDGGLPVSTLRGQMADNRAWLQLPEGVAIVVGTVDMVGSRLLFSGYGVSRRMRPVHAALLGSDALIVLDEAHLVPPFEALLKSVSGMVASQQAIAPLAVPPMRLLSLSATGRSSEGRRFSLTADDRADAPVTNRLDAVKRLKLFEVVPLSALAKALTEQAIERAAESGAVVVFCNNRKIAQEVREALNQVLKGRGKGKIRSVELLVGERRVQERMRHVHSAVFARFSPDRHRPGVAAPALSGPAFLVATSAGEVGVDLDADHMVCDLVAWERMVQRLGRVNRRPLMGSAWVDVIPVEHKADKDTEQAALSLDAWQAPFRSSAWPVGDDGRLDASPGCLMQLRLDAAFASAAAAATSESSFYPALTLPHVQAWAMTSLKEHAGRTLVAPWLRGWVKETPQCRVVWRLHLPLRETDGSVLDDRTAIRSAEAFFKAAPAHLSETIEAPVWRVVDVLRARVKALQKVSRADSAVAGRPLAVIVLDDAGDVEAIVGAERFGPDAKNLDRLFSGRTLIVDARIGGLDVDGLLDHKADQTCLRTFDDGGEWTPSPEVIGYRVRTVNTGTWEGGEPDQAWRIETTWTSREDGAEPDLIVEVYRDSASDEGDPALSKWAQRLDEHQAWTARHAAGIADALGLGEPHRAMLIAGAAVHDEGKRRPEWQRAIGMWPDGGDEWAKSGQRAPADALPVGRSDARSSPLLMAGFRHEFGSVRDAAAMDGRLPAEEPDGRRDGWRDLCLHLIAAHHGHARPTIPAYDPATPPTVAQALAQQIALRYARLEARWGPWGLAWWEAVLQAADWHASAQLNAVGEHEVGHG